MSAKLFSELKLITDNLSLFMQQPTEKPLKEMVKIVDKYKYLVVWFTEHVEWNTTDKAIAEAASKAMYTLTSCARTCSGLVFQSLLMAVYSQWRGVWGICERKHVSSVWFRACRCYLGV